jgi:outer membrane protein, multidrug efflux system
MPYVDNESPSPFGGGWRRAAIFLVTVAATIGAHGSARAQPPAAQPPLPQQPTGSPPGNQPVAQPPLVTPPNPQQKAGAAQTIESAGYRTPDVTDPMLAPPQEAPRHIASWDEALSLIRSQSPDYITGQQSVVRAEAQKQIALAAVLPVLGVQGSYTHQFYTAAFSFAGFTLVEPPPTVWSFGVGATWQALNPRAIYQVGTANKNIDLTKLTFANERRLIAQSVISALLATLAAERVADVNRVGLRYALQRLALTQARLQFGQGTALDVDRGQADVESARRLIIAGDESLLQSREALGAALGSPVAISPPGNLDLDQFESAVSHTCRLNQELDKRPDVIAAESQVQIAKRHVTEAWLLFSPSVSLASNFADNSVAVLGPTKTWDIEAVLTIPVYDGGARYGALRDARAALEQARQSLVETRLSAIVGSAQADRLVGVRQAAQTVAKRQVEVAQRIDERTRDGYAKGIGTSLDLVTSAQALRQAEIDLAILDYQVAEARADALLTNAECEF